MTARYNIKKFMEKKARKRWMEREELFKRAAEFGKQYPELIHMTKLIQDNQSTQNILNPPSEYGLSTATAGKKRTKKAKKRIGSKKKKKEREKKQKKGPKKDLI